MGVLDFLFEGSPPPSTTTYGTTVNNMPQWLSDYTQGIIARANTQAAEPYQQYGGPRVAGFTDDQNNAFDVIRNNIGGWNDEFDASKQATQGGLSQAMPLFQQAAQSTPSQIQQYMDPYVGSVIDRGTQLAMRNYNENLAPQISARFIRGGQSGSTAHQRETENAARDLTEGVQSNAMAALSQAYNTAGTQFQTDASRYGQLGTNIGNLSLEQGRDLGNLATLQQSLGLKDAQALDAAGQEQQQQVQKNYDTAYGDFQAQRDFPRQNIDWLNNIIKGVPNQSTQTTSQTGPGNNFQPSPISQLISLYGLYKDVKSADGGLIEAEPRFADGGIVDHIPGPAMGAVYARYGDGGKVKTVSAVAAALRRILEGRGAVDAHEIDDGRANRALEIYRNAASDGVYPNATDDEIKSNLSKLAKRKINFADGGGVKALHTAADQMDGIIAKALGIAVGGRGGLSALEFGYGT